MLGLFPPLHTQILGSMSCHVTGGQLGWESHPSKQLQGSAVQTLKAAQGWGMEVQHYRKAIAQIYFQGSKSGASV